MSESKKPLEHGLQFGAELYETKDLWFICGGNTSERFILSNMPESSEFRKISPLLFLSTYASFEIISIDHHHETQSQPVTLHKSENFEDLIHKSHISSSRRRRKHSNAIQFNFGISLKIDSTQYSEVQEGVFHHILMNIINEINGF